MDSHKPLSNESNPTETTLTALRTEVRELSEQVSELTDLVSKQKKTEAYEAKVLYKLRDEVAELRKDLPLAKQDAERGDELYDIASLAKRWDVSERTIAKEVSEGTLEPTYIRTSLRFTPESVCAYERTATGRRRRRGARRRAAEKPSS